MTFEDDTKRNILHATAKKFFPDWEITVGVTPHPWARVAHDAIIVEVHVDRAISLTDFPEEAWLQFKKLRDDVNRGDYYGEPV